MLPYLLRQVYFTVRVERWGERGVRKGGGGEFGVLTVGGVRVIGKVFLWMRNGVSNLNQ